MKINTDFLINVDDYASSSDDYGINSTLDAIDRTFRKSPVEEIKDKFKDDKRQLYSILRNIKSVTNDQNIISEAEREADKLETGTLESFGRGIEQGIYRTGKGLEGIANTVLPESMEFDTKKLDKRIQAAEPIIDDDDYGKRILNMTGAVLPMMGAGAATGGAALAGGATTGAATLAGSLATGALQYGEAKEDAYNAGVEGYLAHLSGLVQAGLETAGNLVPMSKILSKLPIKASVGKRILKGMAEGSVSESIEEYLQSLAKPLIEQGEISDKDWKDAWTSFKYAIPVGGIIGGAAGSVQGTDLNEMLKNENFDVNVRDGLDKFSPNINDGMPPQMRPNINDGMPAPIQPNIGEKSVYDDALVKSVEGRVTNDNIGPFIEPYNNRQNDMARMNEIGRAKTPTVRDGLYEFNVRNGQIPGDNGPRMIEGNNIPVEHMTPQEPQGNGLDFLINPFDAMYNEPKLIEDTAPEPKVFTDDDAYAITLMNENRGGFVALNNEDNEIYKKDWGEYGSEEKPVISNKDNKKESVNGNTSGIFTKYKNYKDVYEEITFSEYGAKEKVVKSNKDKLDKQIKLMHSVSFKNIIKELNNGSGYEGYNNNGEIIKITNKEWMKNRNKINKIINSGIDTIKNIPDLYYKIHELADNESKIAVYKRNYIEDKLETPGEREIVSKLNPKDTEKYLKNVMNFTDDNSNINDIIDYNVELIKGLNHNPGNQYDDEAYEIQKKKKKLIFDLFNEHRPDGKKIIIPIDLSDSLYRYDLNFDEDIYGMTLDEALDNDDVVFVTDLYEDFDKDANYDLRKNNLYNDGDPFCEGVVFGNTNYEGDLEGVNDKTIKVLSKFDETSRTSFISALITQITARDVDIYFNTDSNLATTLDLLNNLDGDKFKVTEDWLYDDSFWKTLDNGVLDLFCGDYADYEDSTPIPKEIYDSIIKFLDVTDETWGKWLKSSIDNKSIEGFNSLMDSGKITKENIIDAFSSAKIKSSFGDPTYLNRIMKYINDNNLVIEDELLMFKVDDSENLKTKTSLRPITKTNYNCIADVKNGALKKSGLNEKNLNRSTNNKIKFYIQYLKELKLFDKELSDEYFNKKGGDDTLWNSDIKDKIKDIRDKLNDTINLASEKKLDLKKNKKIKDKLISDEIKSMEYKLNNGNDITDKTGEIVIESDYYKNKIKTPKGLKSINNKIKKIAIKNAIDSYIYTDTYLDKMAIRIKHEIDLISDKTRLLNEKEGIFPGRSLLDGRYSKEELDAIEPKTFNELRRDLQNELQDIGLSSPTMSNGIVLESSVKRGTTHGRTVNMTEDFDISKEQGGTQGTASYVADPGDVEAIIHEITHAALNKNKATEGLSSSAREQKVMNIVSHFLLGDDINKQDLIDLGDAYPVIEKFVKGFVKQHIDKIPTTLAADEKSYENGMYNPESDIITDFVQAGIDDETKLKNVINHLVKLADRNEDLTPEQVDEFNRRELEEDLGKLSRSEGEAEYFIKNSKGLNNTIKFLRETKGLTDDQIGEVIIDAFDNIKLMSPNSNVLPEFDKYFQAGFDPDDIEIKPSEKYGLSYDEYIEVIKNMELFSNEVYNDLKNGGVLPNESDIITDIKNNPLGLAEDEFLNKKQKHGNEMWDLKLMPYNDSDGNLKYAKQWINLKTGKSYDNRSIAKTKIYLDNLDPERMTPMLQKLKDSLSSIEEDIVDYDDPLYSLLGLKAEGVNSIKTYYDALQNPKSKLPPNDIKNSVLYMADAVITAKKIINKNKVYTNLIDTILGSKKFGINTDSYVRKVSNTSKRSDIINIIRDGELESYLIAPGIKEAIEGAYNLNESAFKKTQQDINSIFKTVIGTTHFFRSLITHTPAFAIRNLIRDFQSQVLATTGQFGANEQTKGELNEMDIEGYLRQNGLLGDRTIVSAKQDFYRTQLERTKDILQSGGIVMDTKTLGTDTNSIMDKLKSIMDKLKSIKGTYVDNIDKLNDWSEALGRTREFKRAYAKAREVLKYSPDRAKEYALYETQNILNFQKSGSNMRFIGSMIAFLNSNIQALRKVSVPIFNLIRKVKNGDKLSTQELSDIESRKTSIKYAIGLAVGLTLAQEALKSFNGGDDLDDDTLNKYWQLSFGPGNNILIPKGFEDSVIGNFIRNMWDTITGKDGEYLKSAFNFGENIIPNSETGIDKMKTIFVDVLYNGIKTNYVTGKTSDITKDKMASFGTRSWDKAIEVVKESSGGWYQMAEKLVDIPMSIAGKDINKTDVPYGPIAKSVRNILDFAGLRFADSKYDLKNFSKIDDIKRNNTIEHPSLKNYNRVFNKLSKLMDSAKNRFYKDKTPENKERLLELIGKLNTFAAKYTNAFNKYKDINTKIVERKKKRSK